MTPRMIVPLLRYTDARGTEREVSLVQHQPDQPPRIVSGSGPEAIDVPLSTLFGVQITQDPIRQLIGDGPEFAELPADRVREAAALAQRALPASAGRFRVVWVPDDGLPF
ncbi:hypothetical protein [Achromobacter sp. 2789STDY5608621]|uniref:hypothetical protein n=2 Tax=Alcaligenaceae TaxID=506 RepID=UPI0006C46901|nr:hypothetical protein [Achromobacter sp. 2789STDY5608621]CUJ43427.1 Uncharacterised protein [Achromobacter sp. 2789STDY5608621]